MSHLIEFLRLAKSVRAPSLLLPPKGSHASIKEGVAIDGIDFLPAEKEHGLGENLASD